MRTLRFDESENNLKDLAAGLNMAEFSGKGSSIAPVVCEKGVSGVDPILPQGTGSPQGLVIFKNKQGKVLLKQFVKPVDDGGMNLVVLRGRVFALEKMFNLDLDSATFPGYDKNRDRQICLFKVGKGGCLPGDPFNPIAVQHGEKGLAKELPFRKLVPSLGDKLTEEEKTFYADERIDKSTAEISHSFYAKRINSSINSFKPEWKFNPATNECAVKVTLKIDTDDFEDEVINEIGLFMAKITGNQDGSLSFDQQEMFSRITFDSEPMRGNKELIVEYFIWV